MRRMPNRQPTPPLVRKEISAILMMAFGILLFMGIFMDESAGSFGYALQVLFGGLMGVTAYILPFLVFGQGLYRMFSRSGHPLWNRFFNLVLLLLLISAMFQTGAHPKSFYGQDGLFKLIALFFKEGVATLDTASSQVFFGGGIFGGLLGVPLLFVFQKAGAMVVLATLGLVIALVVTRISIMDAARSMARGTADTLNNVREASRRRREARLEMYEAQTVEARVPRDETSGGWFGRWTAKWVPEQTEMEMEDIPHLTGVSAEPGSPEQIRKDGQARLSGSGRNGEQGRQDGQNRMDERKQEEQAARKKGGRFIDVEPFDPWDLPEDQEPEAGPTFQYPSSFVHIEHDVGDLRVGRDEGMDAGTPLGECVPGEGMTDPADGFPEGESALPAYAMAPDLSADTPLAVERVLPMESDLSTEPAIVTQSGVSGISGVSAASNGALPSATTDPIPVEALRASATKPGPKAEWLGKELVPPPNGDRKLTDPPERDLARQWEDNLEKEEARRREGGGTPAFGEGYRDEETPEARPYSFPPVFLLKQSKEDEQNKRRIQATAEENARKLEATLESFGIGAKVIHVSVGPAITRYELQPAPGIKVSRIVNLTDDIALNLASSGVRIEAPIPGKAAIGVEVPNKEVAPISLRSVLESPEFENHPSKLAVALGKDISGENVVIDLAKMPHMLIAGATGSGKSVCINSIVVSLLYKAKPEEVKLVMIDPKVVELGVYNGIPHLLIPVVTDPNKAAGALRWAVQEMVMRYKLFAERGVRDLAGYNNAVEETGNGMKLPQMVIIIDELADLMMVAPHDVEDSICRLAQMARAAGMHLVIATQRPSVNVITGVIKANVPSRVAFSVSSQVDSRTIIDMAGAEKLLGKGDMLYYPVGYPKPVRVKGAFISDKEVEVVVEHVKAQLRVKYDENIIDNINDSQPSDEGEPEAEEGDGLLDEAIEALIDSGQASVSFIQRRFKVGYARAGRIIDQMAERGIISGYEGSKPRRVLITREMWNEMRMQNEIRAAEANRGSRAVEQQRMRVQTNPPVQPSAAFQHPDRQTAQQSNQQSAQQQERYRNVESERFIPVMPAPGLDRNPVEQVGRELEQPVFVRQEAEPIVNPVESSFLRRAMEDAEAREIRRETYGDEMTPAWDDDGLDSRWNDPDPGRGSID